MMRAVMRPSPRPGGPSPRAAQELQVAAVKRVFEATKGADKTALPNGQHDLMLDQVLAGLDDGRFAASLPGDEVFAWIR